MMNELLPLVLVGVALSMDTFSVSVGIGIANNIEKKKVLISTVVGIMHFIMPFLGTYLGKEIFDVFKINHNLLISLIFIIISYEMIYEGIKYEPKKIKFTFFSILLFALSVSLDSFSTGLGMMAITSHNVLASTIFSLCSFSFTYSGLVLGNYIQSKFGRYANFIGSVILIVMAIIYLCKV